MALPYHSLRDVAAILGIEWCRGIQPSGYYCPGGSIRHRRGYVEGGLVHMADRRLNRAVIRRFLVLVAENSLPQDEMEPWESLWRRCVLAEKLASKVLHIRIPSKLWALDRWAVRAQLVDVPTSDPARAAALRWANL